MMMTRPSTFRLAIISCGLILAGLRITGSADEVTPEIRYLLIQPVVTRSDEGKEPAPVRLYREKVTQVYRQAGVEAVWLPQVFLDSTATRDGELSPDEIVVLGEERKLWGEGVPRINLIFVNAINGKAGPRGLGMTPGPICFIALPPEGDRPDMEAFCMIHEMGHNLGLIHAVDDPNADDQVPSIMGDGPFAERIGDSALQESHVATIQKSPLLLRQVHPWPQSEE